MPVVAVGGRPCTCCIDALVALACIGVPRSSLCSGGGGAPVSLALAAVPRSSSLDVTPSASHQGRVGHRGSAPPRGRPTAAAAAADPSGRGTGWPPTGFLVRPCRESGVPLPRSPASPPSVPPRRPRGGKHSRRMPSLRGAWQRVCTYLAGGGAVLSMGLIPTRAALVLVKILRGCGCAPLVGHPLALCQPRRQFGAAPLCGLTGC